MRYMGDATPIIPGLPALPIPIPSLITPGTTPAPTLTPGAPMDPTLKAQMIAQAPNLPDAQAQDLFDVADATTVGQREKWMRIGLGAAGGILLGVVGAVLIKR